MAKHTEKGQPAVKGVSAAERALAVLTAFRRGDGALSLAELAERTGLVKSTIMRLAVSLQLYPPARTPAGRYLSARRGISASAPPTSRLSACRIT